MKKITLLILIVLFPSWVYSQKTSFTSQDVLNVKSFRAMDITNDGQFVAGIIRARKDRLNIDHGRYGDPNYVAPYTSEIVIIDIKEDVTDMIFDTGKIMGGLKWSPEGSDLACMAYEEGEFRLYIYNTANGRTKRIKLKTDLDIASNSLLEWTPDGEYLILSLRSENWKNKGDSLFREATVGPITVYDSKRPFLKWDEIQNHSSLSIPVKVGISSGSVERLLPESRYSNVIC